MITYAQNFEDVMLARLFAERDPGFYIDIGAGDPSHLSVTRHFYERGWRGINVEPIRANWERFASERPRDINLNVAVARSAGRREFCEVVDNDALSSLDATRIDELTSSGVRTRRYQVECVTGDSIFAQAPPDVDFLKVDVEGFEDEVLRSIDLARHRPKALVIEATEQITQWPGWANWSPRVAANWEAWERYVLEAGYVFAHFDGLNRFYLRDDLQHLCVRLSIPPGVFDFIIPDLSEALNRDRVASERAFKAALDEKEAVIRVQKVEVERSGEHAARGDQSLKEKEAVIQTLQAAVDTLASQHRLIAESMAQLQAVVPPAPEPPAPEPPAPTVEPSAELAAVKRLLIEKEAVIRELDGAVRAYRLAYGAMRHVMVPVRAMTRAWQALAALPRKALAPRLGVLTQHPPRRLVLPTYREAAKLANAPRISIVTPSFRQAAFIERTIRSVLDQGYPNLEYFVQDGGSEDGTRAILERYADRLAGWESRPDDGQTQAINLGFARTSGEIMAWINSDDILFPGTLASVAEFFLAHPDVDVVYGHRMLLDEEDRQIGRWVMPSHDDQVLSWADFIPQETLYWRRRIWDKAGGRVDESFRFAMDWDLLVRFREAGARFARLPRFLGGFRIHAQQKTSAVITDIGFQEMDRIRARALGRVPSYTEVRNAVAPYMLRHVLSDIPWRIRDRLGGAA